MKMGGVNKEEKEFAKTLLQWNRQQNDRQMPWKGEKDPYKIWLSEIILQQTRVAQGLNYYNNFIKKFPDIKKLARAQDATIFKLWEGLGYYSRCRNLIATARFIATEKKGVFPAAYKDIIALKGIGPYTAAAISSFAYNLPYAVVDGNVFRVLARVFGIDTPIDSTEGKKYFTKLAEELLDKKQPGLYNQAIMDFGAVVCKPSLPLCDTCLFNTTCYAFLHKKINVLPVKEKKLTIRKRWFYYLVIEHNGKTAIRKRIEKDIWQDLYEFPVIETTHEEDTYKVLQLAEQKGWLKNKSYEVVALSPLFKQQLTHQLIAGRFISVKLKKKPVSNENEIWVNEKEIKKYGFPKFINQYLSHIKEQNLF